MLNKSIKGISTKAKTELLFMLLGALIFYFLVHPFSMILNIIESSSGKITAGRIFEIMKEHLVMSFTSEMFRLSLSYIIFGSLIGLIFGLFQSKLLKSNLIIQKQGKIISDDILRWIEMGESNWLELKSSLRYDYKTQEVNKNLEVVIAKTIAGFLNSNGGKLIIGANDNGDILGLENDYLTLKIKNKDGFEMKIFQIINGYIGRQACFNIHVTFIDINTKEVCLVSVNVAKEPIYLSDKNNDKFYVRTGNATNPLSLKETVQYLNNRKL